MEESAFVDLAPVASVNVFTLSTRPKRMDPRWSLVTTRTTCLGKQKSIKNVSLIKKMYNSIYPRITNPLILYNSKGLTIMTLFRQPYFQIRL